MAALDKLINLLEQIKETDPEFSPRAAKALDALIEEEKKVEPPPPKPPPSTVKLTDHHWGDIQKTRELVAQSVTRLGLLQQNYESDKETLLDIIESQQASLQKYVESLYEIYNLDSGSNYNLVFPAKVGENATFVRKQI